MVIVRLGTDYCHFSNEGVGAWCGASPMAQQKFGTGKPFGTYRAPQNLNSDAIRDDLRFQRTWLQVLGLRVLSCGRTHDLCRGGLFKNKKWASEEARLAGRDGLVEAAVVHYWSLDRWLQSYTIPQGRSGTSDAIFLPDHTWIRPHRRVVTQALWPFFSAPKFVFSGMEDGNLERWLKCRVLEIALKKFLLMDPTQGWLWDWDWCAPKERCTGRPIVDRIWCTVAISRTKLKPRIKKKTNSSLTRQLWSR